MNKNGLLYAGLLSLAGSLGAILLGNDADVVSGARPFYKDYFGLNDWALGGSDVRLEWGVNAPTSSLP